MELRCVQWWLLHSNASMPVTDLTWVHRVDWTLNSDWNWCSCWNVLDLCFDFTTLHTRISSNIWSFASLLWRRKVLVLVRQYCKSIGIWIAILSKNLYWYWYWQYFFVKVLLTTLSRGRARRSPPEVDGFVVSKHPKMIHFYVIQELSKPRLATPLYACVLVTYLLSYLGTYLFTRLLTRYVLQPLLYKLSKIVLI